MWLKRAFAPLPDALANPALSFLPLGQFRIRTAFRRDLTGMLEGSSPYPWNLRRG